MYETYKDEFVKECEKAIDFLREMKSFIEHHSEENELSQQKGDMRRCFLSIEMAIDDLKYLAKIEKAK